ncbi:hypothetical protein [Variovorax sp. LjRoot178]|uniref:hypothetical protein n=1 Tax=Variovorax sp. LjRoot178 TaxID=3342277 RepID=UPI003ECE2BB3
MNEISYNAAIDSGLEPITYRMERVQELGPGEFPGRLDGLVWINGRPALMALVTLQSGDRVGVIAYKRSSRKEIALPWSGLRGLTPGESVILDIDVGLRGGLRPLVRSNDPERDPRIPKKHESPPTPDPPR